MPPRARPATGMQVGICHSPVRSSCTWKPTYTLARLMVGDHLQREVGSVGRHAQAAAVFIPSTSKPRCQWQPASGRLSQRQPHQVTQPSHSPGPSAGAHQSVKRRLGIWFRPDRCALVSFLYFMLSSKPGRGAGRGRGGRLRSLRCRAQPKEQPRGASAPHERCSYSTKPSPTLTPSLPPRTRRLLPEQALPGGEVGALEQRVLQDALHSAQRLGAQ